MIYTLAGEKDEDSSNFKKKGGVKGRPRKMKFEKEFKVEIDMEE